MKPDFSSLPREENHGIKIDMPLISGSLQTLLILLQGSDRPCKKDGVKIISRHTVVKSKIREALRGGSTVMFHEYHIFSLKTKIV